MDKITSIVDGKVMFVIGNIEERDLEKYINKECMENCGQGFDFEELSCDCNISCLYLAMKRLVEYENSKCRKEVRVFSEKMEKTLKANDHKSGWKDCEDRFLLLKLTEEFREVIQLFVSETEWVVVDRILRLIEELIQRAKLSTKDKLYKDLIERECADVANIAMMLCDEERA